MTKRKIATEMTGSEVFALALGVPALLAWIAYGACWLLDPRLAGEQNPLIWAAYAAGGWYVLMAVIVGGPLVLVGL